MNALIETIDALDAFFSDETKWGKGGHPTAAATCWCIAEGLYRVVRSAGRKEYDDIHHAAYSALCDTLGVEDALDSTADGLLDWNDAEERTFADIKKLIADTRARVQSSADKGDSK